jgi:hypothetical protein
MCKASHATIPDSSVEPVGSKIFEPGPDGLYFSGQRISKYPSRNTNLTNIDGVILYSIKILIMAVQIKKWTVTIQALYFLSLSILIL